MRYRILTVDDSKTVRIIVRKAFKGFDCDILEAANGVEGLAVAGKDVPDVILLDVTMPVMDGVEMLTKLKADPQLKGIPVVMLTAEGGRENVLKVAKIGVRDYIVKPFKEDLLIEKLGRIIDLKPLSEGPVKAKSILDPCDIVVAEDKPVIIQQIQDGLAHMPWTIRGVSTTGEAVDACQRQVPDIFLISLSLPDEGAFKLFRHLRTNLKTKYTPVFALVVKTETSAQQQAQQIGFSAIITKPIEIAELEAKMAKAMNLDTSPRYFTLEKDCFVMRLPENCSPIVINEVSNYLKPKLAEAVNAGMTRAIIDVEEVKGLNMTIIKLLFQTMQTCRELAMQFSLVGNPQIVAECKGFEDTRNWSFFESMNEARAYLAAKAPPARDGAEPRPASPATTTATATPATAGA
ncbi:MAG: response regulator [Opitutaceae bacterium]|nr:response regulator [Opitutaceae bacterium]